MPSPDDDKNYLAYPAAEVMIKDEAWHQFPNLPRLIEDILNHTFTDSCEISILLTNDTHIQQLNKDFRDKDQATNVLSFPTGEADFLGDIAIALETLVREAEEQQKDFYHHFAHILIHGILHLRGHDHLTDTDAIQMEALEIKILEDMGIKNPYKEE